MLLKAHLSWAQEGASASCVVMLCAVEMGEKEEGREREKLDAHFAQAVAVVTF